MSFTALTTAETASGTPLTQAKMRKIRDNFDYLYGMSAAAGTDVVPNGSFEVDSDSDGTPDSWTKSLYAGGAFAIETTSPDHGAKSIKFTHPGGGSNGGGYIDSDYIPVSALNVYTVAFIHWASAAGMKNKVQIRYFDKAKEELVAGSPEDIYNSTANPTSPTAFRGFFCPLATTRFIKIRLVGGFTDTDVAGIAYFDDVSIHKNVPAASRVAGDDPVANDYGVVTTNQATWIKKKEILMKAGGAFRVVFDLSTGDAVNLAYARIYKNGVQIGTERSCLNTPPTVFTEDFTGFVPGDRVQLYLNVVGGSVATNNYFSIRAGSQEDGIVVAV